MKKIMISLAIASIAMVSFAQETVSEVVVPTKKHSVMTNGWWDNWFISVNGGISMYDGVYATGDDIFDRIAPAISAYVGKWHTPGYGWRIAYNGWEVKPYGGNVPAGLDEKQSFMNFHFDAMFNLSNLLCGYNSERVWNVIPYAGVGFAGQNYADDWNGSLSANFGLINTWRLSDNWAINLEGSFNMFRNGFNGVLKKDGSGSDVMWGVTAGVTYKFPTATWENTPDVDAIMAMNAAALAELNAQLQAKSAENAQLKNQLAAAKAGLAKAQEKVAALESAPKYLDAAQSVFFAFNSSKIASKKEIINLQALADAAKQSGVKLNVFGYADTTGTDEYNLKLSEARAEAVKAELVKMGVAAEQIDAKGLGESNVESSKSLNRRVVISVAK